MWGQVGYSPTSQAPRPARHNASSQVQNSKWLLQGSARSFAAQITGHVSRRLPTMQRELNRDSKTSAKWNGDKCLADLSLKLPQALRVLCAWTPPQPLPEMATTPSTERLGLRMQLQARNCNSSVQESRFPRMLHRKVVIQRSGGLEGSTIRASLSA